MRRTVLQLATLTGHFAGPTWAAWRVVLKAIFALPLSEAELLVYRELTGRTDAPAAPAREGWLVCGRRAGKSIIAALVAVYLATCRTYRLAPGEVGVLAIVAADRRQARVVRDYVGGLLHSTPVLAALIARESAESVELTNGVLIEVSTSSSRSIRGRTLIGAVCDEVAFWPIGDDAADPDRAVLDAIRPAMATVPNALLLCLSSPYARRGELWRAHRDHYGRDGDPVLVVQAPTRTLNATVPQEEIDRAMAEDAAVASAEYGAQFRADVESFIDRDAVEACVVAGRRELPPIAGILYAAFVDPSGGSADSFTLAIGHTERRAGGPAAVVDAIRERRPPFSPEAVVAEMAGLLKTYKVDRVVGDRYAGEWPREAFKRHGVTYEPADRPKSDYYRDALAVLNGQRVELLDHDRLVAQLVSLERRTARGGRDTIDHAPGAHDDVANVVAGLAVRLAVDRSTRPSAGTWGSRRLTASADVAEVRVRLGLGGPGRIVATRSLAEVLAERASQRR